MPITRRKFVIRSVATVADITLMEGAVDRSRMREIHQNKEFHVKSMTVGGEEL